MARYLATQPHQHAHDPYRQAVCLCGGFHRSPRAAARCVGVRRLEDSSQYGWQIRRCRPYSTWREVLAWEGSLSPEEEEQIWR